MSAAYLAAFGQAIREGCTPAQALDEGLEAMRGEQDLARGTAEYGFPCRIYAMRFGPHMPSHPIFHMIRAALKAGRTVTFIDEGRIEKIRRKA